MDIRSVTTQKRIQTGFIELLKNKSFAMCKVSDIIAFAQVSKKTFYTYYNNKYELATAIEDNLINGLKDSLELDRKAFISVQAKYPVDKLDKLADTSFDHTIEFCDQHKVWFTNLLSSNGDIRLINRIYKLGSDEITKRLTYSFGSSYDNMKNNKPDLFLAMKKLYAHLVIDITIFWMANSQVMSIDEVKSLISIIQTQPFVKLIAYFRKAASSPKETK
ncbi:transcriptional regulator, tetr family [Limosilactobacillus frumenti DSM 13145]|uniref:Transcriptional regulator, tetr family n=1 Tax=Limosilactobacillus frumenti DSM 13145 TaxID=1423746 RepID=A0A0R1P3Z7_9LACO|nr:TetR/AcrR family transcriptional regulator [Limosilactobacillus frumenti]KRL27110.1 transcriptional regulator, tetr family [Limosilactobacillus frumenti DSM 13145]MBA2913798.1 TetR family transcriptional regulator [Limosilactobacillus frumenti]